jgi:hypothetical protein
MMRRLISYRTAPERASENAELIKGVFEELSARAPAGLRYLALNLDDGRFVHFVEMEDGSVPLPQLESFRAFQSGLKDRQIEPTSTSGVTIIGDYRMLAK